MPSNITDRRIGCDPIGVGVTDRRTDEERQHKICAHSLRLAGADRARLGDGMVQLRDNPR